jgi:hypothetical protein
MYFAGEPLNTSDRFLTSVSDPELLIAAPVPDTGGVGSNQIWRFDIVLDRG